MNEELTNEVTNVEETNEVNESEKASGGIGIWEKGIAGLACIGVVAVGVVAVKGGKKAVGWIKGKAAKKKVEPDEDGCVAEAEAEEVDEEESAQKKTSKK